MISLHFSRSFAFDDNEGANDSVFIGIAVLLETILTAFPLIHGCCIRSIDLLRSR